MLDGDGLLAVVDIGEIAIRKIVQHAMIEAVEHAVRMQHRDQRRDDRLGGRIDGVRDIGAVRRVIGIQHQPSVARDQEAVEAEGPAVGNQPGQRLPVAHRRIAGGTARHLGCDLEHEA